PSPPPQSTLFPYTTLFRSRVQSSVRETVWDQDLNTTFFRIFQETLTNIIRHAHATRVDVRLMETANSFVLDVRDNGRGISEEEIDRKSTRLNSSHVSISYA